MVKDLSIVEWLKNKFDHMRVDIPLEKERTKVQERLDLLSKLVRDLIFTLEI